MSGNRLRSSSEEKEAQPSVVEQGGHEDERKLRRPLRLWVEKAADSFKSLESRVDSLFPHNQEGDTDYDAIFCKDSQNQGRENQRQEAMRKICSEFPDCGEPCELRSPEEKYFLDSKKVRSTILEIANKLFEDKNYCFQRFERLAVCDALYWQHKLVIFDEKLRNRKKRKEKTIGDVEKEINDGWTCDDDGHDLTFCLNQYCKRFGNIQWAGWLK